MTSAPRWLVGFAALALIAASCSDSGSSSNGDSDSDSDTTAAQTTSAASDTTATHDDGDGDLGRSFDAPVASITVDGDAADWDAIDGLDVTLEAIVAVNDVDSVDATVKMAHDATNIYMLLAVDDDYLFTAEDHKLSAAVAMLFPVTDGAGEHMGASDNEGENTAGEVDIWHWELDCAAGEMSGGAAAGGVTGTGDDGACNLDDEWATDAETREDDGGDTSENSLLGSWSHSNPVAGEDGIWYFEVSRPLQTGDANDAQFTAGESTLLALAYWDANYSADGWVDDSHAQSSNQGWITVNLVGTASDSGGDSASGDLGRSFDAPVASITVDGDAADWDGIDGLDVTLEAIVTHDDVDSVEATVKMAHDDTHIYMLFTVADDYLFTADDHKLSPAVAMLFPVTDGAGVHMGASDEEGENTAGEVDIWHWELDCGVDELSGGAAAGGVTGTGDDGACNLDDEWATEAENREDDGGDTSENSLLGAWWHSNPVAGEDGIWYFELSRPLQTGDANDAQFAAGESTLLALAYWDADYSADGWTDDSHAQSSNQGWITVTLS